MEMPLCAFTRHIWASTSSGSLTLSQQDATGCHSAWLWWGRAQKCPSATRHPQRASVFGAQAWVPTAGKVKSQEAPWSPSHDVAGWLHGYVCLCGMCVPKHPLPGPSCVHSTEYGSLHRLSLWRHFRILMQDGPLFGCLPLQYSALKKILKGSRVSQIFICLFCDFLPAPCLDLLQIRTC